MADVPLDLLGGALTLALAFLQLAMRGRVDLLGVVLAAGAAAWFLAPATPALAGLLSAAVLVAAVASTRAAARGVGRPELTAGVVAAAVVAHGFSIWMPVVAPAADAGALAAVRAGLVALAGVVAALLAAERRGLRGQRVYHYREVPVGTAEPAQADRT